jgi:beta-phosphoglucomutase
LDLNRYFSVVVTVNEITRSKPDPEIFLKTAQQLGSKPENCVVLEDSIFGVKAAKAGGMGCIAVTQGAYTWEELEKAEPDLTVKSLTEKDALLNFILG